MVKGELGLAIAISAIILAWLVARVWTRIIIPERGQLPDEARVNHMHHSSQINSEG